MIEQSRYTVTQELKSVGTSEVKPTPAISWTFGKQTEFNGHKVIDTERKISYNNGMRIVLTGSHNIAGPGKLSVLLYSGKGDTADTLINTYGPYDAAALGGVEYLAFPPGSYAGCSFQIAFKADQAAATAFTAGTVTATLEMD